MIARRYFRWNVKWMEWIQKDGKTILSGFFLPIRRFDNTFNGLINSRYVYVEKRKTYFMKEKRKKESLSLSLCPRCDSLSGWLRRNKTWKIKHLVNRFSSRWRDRASSLLGRRFANLAFMPLRLLVFRHFKLFFFSRFI